jgi:alpha-beta hydrolase superfamily lysophospholipase
MIAGVRRMRTVSVARPAEMAIHDGLAYSLWLPSGQPKGGVVILHGAASCKESHHDFARFVLPAGLAAIVFDQRGHGASDAPMDGRALDDVASMASLLRERLGEPNAPLAVRGSSMGGCLAILAAPIVRARAVVAICPASVEGLRRALANGALEFDVDVPSLDAMLAGHDLAETVRSLEVPLLLLHAEGDEVVPVEHSRELAKHVSDSRSRLIAIPGGHHRSIQHDAELQAASLLFIEQALAAA